MNLTRTLFLAFAGALFVLSLQGMKSKVAQASPEKVQSSFVVGGRVRP